MTIRVLTVIGLAIGCLCPVRASAQVSSLGADKRRADAEKVIPKAAREAPEQERNYVYEQYAWISSPPAPPKTFKPGDLVTVIIREQRRFEAEADLESKKQFDVRSELDAFIKATAGGLGAAAFRRGKPNIGYKYDHELKNEGDTRREDRLITRIAATIIDVKPNGVLVLEARARIQHDDEISTITLTGICRKEDVTADNTVLSTQIANKHTVVENSGALRAAATRGWIPKLLDLLRPF